MYLYLAWFTFKHFFFLIIAVTEFILKEALHGTAYKGNLVALNCALGVLF